MKLVLAAISVAILLALGMWLSQPRYAFAVADRVVYRLNVRSGQVVACRLPVGYGRVPCAQ